MAQRERDMEIGSTEQGDGWEAQTKQSNSIDLSPSLWIEWFGWSGKWLVRKKRSTISACWSKLSLSHFSCPMSVGTKRQIRRRRRRRRTLHERSRSEKSRRRETLDRDSSERERWVEVQRMSHLSDRLQRHCSSFSSLFTSAGRSLNTLDWRKDYRRDVMYSLLTRVSPLSFWSAVRPWEELKCLFSRAMPVFSLSTIVVVHENRSILSIQWTSVEVDLCSDCWWSMEIDPRPSGAIFSQVDQCL